MRFLSVLVAIAATMLFAMTMPADAHKPSVFDRMSGSHGVAHSKKIAVHAPSRAAPAAHAAASTACSTFCSGAGVCVANQCQCNTGFLGVDCSIQAQMQTPACVATQSGSASMCITYEYVKDVVYGRVQVLPSAGWGAFMFGTKSGMDNGTGLLFSYQNGAPVVQDIQSLKFSTPTILNVSSVPAASIVGFVNSTSGALDIQFQRAADTGIPGLYVLPTTTGVLTSVSLAVGTTYFKHHAAAQCTLTDLVALSQGQAVNSTACPAPPAEAFAI